MYAIVEIAGQQFKVEKDKKIFVHRLEGNEGDQVEFEKVLLIDNDKQIIVGEPVIEGAMVAGKILSHPKGDKVIVFKKKRRKGFKVKKGHRQAYTELLIENIVEKGYVKKEREEKKAVKGAKTEKTPKEAPEAEKKKAAGKAATPATAKKSADTTEEKKTGKAAGGKKEPVKKAAATKKPATSKTKSAAKTTTKKPTAGKKTATAKKPAATKKDTGKKTTPGKIDKKEK
ncbi:MAG TPA: 50S ribosomal protein L21 [Bacteroidetes bacterium]|nr:50S ribosomal protein L21 [Bacteroidota bacterium]